MRRVFKTRWFARWARKERLSDDALCQAITELEQGLIDGDLGGGLVKKRVALPGRGKRGGARTILATNKADRWFFLYGYLKNERDDVELASLDTLREYGREILVTADSGLDKLMRLGELKEICHGG